jgi:cytochrome c-type biogenesis protein CcmH/NrfG/TolB-like protein
MDKSALSNRSTLLLLLAAVFLLAGCGSVALQVKANSALQNKRYDEALAAYQEILKSDPNNVEALKGIGETYLKMKKGPEAVPALEKAYKADPDRRTIINLGLAYAETGNYGKAIDTWDVLLAREPDSNIANLVKKQRLLATYKDASQQAKNALAQERALISSGLVAEQEAVSSPAKQETVREAPPPRSSKKATRSRTSRKSRTAAKEKPRAEVKAVAPSPKPGSTAATRPKAAAIPKEKLDKAFPVNDNIIAVSPFGDKGNTEKTKHLRKALAAMIITDLSKAKGIQVVERIRLQKLLDEMKLGQSGIVDPATSPRIGRLLGAGKIVSGGMLGAGADDLHILRILTSVATGKDLGDQDARGKTEEFFKLQKAIVFGILKDLGIKLTPADEQIINRYATRSYQGLLLYGEGLDWQDLGEWDKAIDAFTRCVNVDPTGPCGSALAGSPSSGEAASSAEAVVTSITVATEADVAAAQAAGVGGGGGGGGH